MDEAFGEFVAWTFDALGDLEKQRQQIDKTFGEFVTWAFEACGEMDKITTEPEPAGPDSDRTPPGTQSTNWPDITYDLVTQLGTQQESISTMDLEDVFCDALHEALQGWVSVGGIGIEGCQISWILGLDGQRKSFRIGDG